jgi:hypothetical protein
MTGTLVNTVTINTEEYLNLIGIKEKMNQLELSTIAADTSLNIQTQWADCATRTLTILNPTETVKELNTFINYLKQCLSDKDRQSHWLEFRILQLKNEKPKKKKKKWYQKIFK